MIVGVPKEIKDNEYRVAMVPSGVKALVDAGHSVVVEKGAGLGSGFPDEAFAEAGGELLDSAQEVYARAELIVKVKEPQPVEYAFLREGQIIFSFLHLAPAPELKDALIKSGVTAIAYETVEGEDGALPVLKPMSEVAGRLSVQLGAQFLLKPNGGEGLLIGGVPGVERGIVTVIGAGTAGVNAARVALALGADVTVIDIRMDKLRYVEDIFRSRAKTLFSTAYNIEKSVRASDLLIGAVHRPGARTPRLVTKEMVSAMKKGSVIVDISVDQGGCVETIRPTTHSKPTYLVDGVIHYGVSNMPGAVPRTSTLALTNATLPYVLKIADLGLKDAAASCASLRRGVNIHRGAITHPAVAEAFGVEAEPLEF